ncbi:F-box/LRR-repeat protein 5-like [Saccoglossus kowalevskii]|uniref:F-box/LRR-repeat protein 5 n=1 Tax=Saccoglossus kowalevskii TaxID=10224 RepID=A0ABM0GYE8_SACKO|nr:PREDICTED: F-box/LRR-repeat protein 5-like [Saccoglossus kowalevskii]
MAPAPSEIDVFSIPHTRIVKQLEELTDTLSATNFSNHVDWDRMLDNLRTTFTDFKFHEKIENECIMWKLKSRLKRLKIEIAAVTNVHSDNHLTDMLDLVEDCFKRGKNKTEDDRVHFGRMLVKALREFTKDFLPHLKEEEEVFQQLLMKYFTFDELKVIKFTVLERHSQLNSSPDEYAKYLKDTEEKPTVEDCCGEDNLLHKIPPEIILKIFGFLGPKDLCRCAMVCHSWSKLALSGKLWQCLHPVRWIKGSWYFGLIENESNEDTEKQLDSSSSTEDLYVTIDDDADFDESEESDASDTSILSYKAMCIRKEARSLTEISKYLIPVVGWNVHTLVLSNSYAITNGVVYKMIISCPNLQHLNLSETNVSDVAFKGLGRNGAGGQLKYLDLSGCLKITDTTLVRLAKALGMNPQKVEMCCVGACLPDTNQQINDCHSVVEKCVWDVEDDDDDEKDVDEVAMALPNNDEVAIESCDETLNCISNRREISNDYSGSSNVYDHKLNEDIANVARDNTLASWTNTDWTNSDGYETITYEQNCSSELRTTFEPPLAVTDSYENIVTCKPDCGQYCRNRKAKYSSGDTNWDLFHQGRPLEFLGLSSCYQITDHGLRALANNGGLPNLRHLDLSGCFDVTSTGLREIAKSSPCLDPHLFFYCDNITDGPLQESASGCQNLQCMNRVCCRSGE